QPRCPACELIEKRRGSRRYSRRERTAVSDSCTIILDVGLNPENERVARPPIKTCLAAAGNARRRRSRKALKPSQRSVEWIGDQRSPRSRGIRPSRPAGTCIGADVEASPVLERGSGFIERCLDRHVCRHCTLPGQRGKRNTN